MVIGHRSDGNWRRWCLSLLSPSSVTHHTHNSQAHMLHNEFKFLKTINEYTATYYLLLISAYVKASFLFVVILSWASHPK